MIADLTADHVNAYLSHLLTPADGKPKGKARMAHNTALDVKAFANWLIQRGLIAEDQFDFGNVEIPKASRDGRPTLPTTSYIKGEPTSSDTVTCHWYATPVTCFGP